MKYTAYLAGPILGFFLVSVAERRWLRAGVALAVLVALYACGPAFLSLELHALHH